MSAVVVFGRTLNIILRLGIGREERGLAENLRKDFSDRAHAVPQDLEVLRRLVVALTVAELNTYSIFGTPGGK